MRLLAAGLVLGLVNSIAAAHQLAAVDDLGDLSLEQLANIQVTSVAKRPTSVADAAASVYVITSDEIRRMGVTTIPEALRLAPNLQVARGSNVEYAISARGFNNAVGNKLLVLIDGRTVYTPVYSGVFWEMQDTLMEDIDRIEVISGPGATLWGANAVNGVINIITKDVADTNGLLLRADAGATEQGAAVRYGGATARAYAQFREWDASVPGAGSLTDEWRRAQVGFRSNWETGKNLYTLQGDWFRGESADRGVAGPFVIPRHTVGGNNLLWRLRHQATRDSTATVQIYWDRFEREEFVIFQPKVDVIDFDFEHDLHRGDHHWVWGVGYRRSRDDVTPGFFSSFQPPRRRLEWGDIFVQDEIQVGDAVQFTLGAKLEHNPYTHLEVLPNARVAWRFAPSHTLWASVSRAVRAPSRYDRDIFFPEDPPHIVAGGPDFESEVANVLDVGLRGQPSERFSYSLTAFHHDWSRLRSGTGLPVPIMLVNNIEGTSTGIEGWANWQLTPGWRLSGGFTTLGKDLAFRAGTSEDSVGVNNPTLHNDPDYQWMVRSRHDLAGDVELDFHLYGVDELTVEPVPAYTELDFRLAWRPSGSLEVALVGRNLLNNSHAEFGAEGTRHEVERSASLILRWRL